jgi:hypothetical protein
VRTTPSVAKTKRNRSKVSPSCHARAAPIAEGTMAAVKKGALTSLIHIRSLVETNEMISLPAMFCSVNVDNMFSFSCRVVDRRLEKGFMRSYRKRLSPS